MDLIADIHFTNYRAWGRELGWEEVCCQTLAGWADLGDPDGAGGRFSASCIARAAR